MHLAIKQVIFTVISFLLMSSGIVLAIYWNSIYSYLMAKNMALAPGSETFKIWGSPPFDVFFDVYLFNWTNPSNLKKKNFQKPIFKEIGPYRFREVHTKTKVEWHSRNSTVSYKRKSVYFFDEKGSKGRLDDIIVTLNAFAASVAYASRDWNFFLKSALSQALKRYKHKTYVVKTARELLFDGYDDKLISLAHSASKLLPIKLEVPYDRFGWFYGRNETDDLMGHYNIFTGQDEISKMGKVKTWNYQTATPFYPSPCNDVHGSGGEFYPPNQPKNQPLSVFNGELCRYLNLYFDRDEVMDGVKGLRFVGKEQSVDNGSRFSENICFSGGHNYPSGIMDVSVCRFGAPVMVSFPHFHAADPYYLEMVEGLSPKKDIHEMSVIVEPDTGLPLELAGRLQINVLVQPTPHIELFRGAQTIFFPALWFEEKVSIPDELMWKLTLSKWMPIIGYACIGVLIFIGLIMLICTYTCKCRSKNTINFTKKVLKKCHDKREAQKSTIEAESSADETPH